MRIAVLSETLSVLGGGEKHGLRMLEPLLGRHEITVFYRPQEGFSTDLIEQRFGLRLEGVRFVPVRHPWSLRRLTIGFDLFLNITFGNVAESSAKKQILMVYFPMPLDDVGRRPIHVRCDQWWLRRQHRLLEYLDAVDPRMLGVGIREYGRRFGGRAVAARLHLFALRKLAGLGRYDRHRLGRTGIGRYDLFLAISEYSARWVERNFGRNARVLYPPIDVQQFQPASKERIILSVGRFDPEPNSKKHHVLLATFKELYDTGVLHGWRLWLCGACDGRATLREYARQLEEDARGYPVTVAVNLPLPRLVELYGRASLYWHAMGFGQHPDKDAYRFEHFGMTTVEAMAAGCIPMVIAAGGQLEIVTHGQDGFLWSTLAELKRGIADYLQMPAEAEARMRAAARERAGFFSPERFRERVIRIYESLGVPAGDSPLADVSGPSAAVAC